MAGNAPLAQVLGPAGGGQPLWGLNDQGSSSSDAQLFSTDPWDTFYMGTRQLPGECELIPGGIAAIELNVKKGKGSNVTRITYAGYAAKKFSITCEICTAAQWAELQDIIDVYWTIPNKVSNLSQIAVSVFHPNLAWIKIFSAVLEDVTPLVRGKSGEGFMMTTLTFQENPPAAAKKNVTKSAGPPAEAPSLPNSNQRGGTPKPTPPSSNPINASVLGAPISGD
jgi:hypothetical protein